jgi:tetratricopeptide (TPR) repeat protein
VPEIALRQYENEINHLIEEARYLEALAHTRHILHQHPHYIGAYYLLGKTMLEADQPELAIDMFQRALNADPEHLMARIGLTMAHQRLDNLNAAIWNLERAVELNPGDADLVDELRQLYGQRDGLEPERIPLNRAGLARLYMRGNRPGRAVEELRALLAENPQRLDLRLALVEAYWRDDQIVQAADTCQTLLDDARYCLKANLLLGALWIDSGQEEGQTYLDRAQEIDLENTLAGEMFGAASPLKSREVSIEHLTYKHDTLDIDRQAKWFKRLEAASVSVDLGAMQPEMTAAEARLVDITAGLEAQIEIPDWLRELGSEEDGALSWMADIGAEVEADKPATGPVAETQMPDWLRAEEVEEIAAEQELPDWLSTAETEEAAFEVGIEGLEPEEGIGAAAGISDWLEQLEPATQTAEGTPGSDVPDWLQALQPAAPTVEEIPLPAEGLPDWLSELKRPGEAAEIVEGEPFAEVAPSEEVPDWLQSLQPAAEAEIAETEEEALPDWMEHFEGVGETAEEVLAVEEGALPDWMTGFQTEEAAKAVVPTEEAPEAGVPEAGVPDWLSEFQPAEAAVEEVPFAEEIAPGAGEVGTGVPDWLSELEPATGLEAEAVEGDLLDWLSEIPAEEAATTAEETLPVELAFSEEIAPAVEEMPAAEGFFGWEAFGEEITEVETVHFVEEEVSPPEATAEGDASSTVLSGDDALAWLESLTVGKEEELRAQAEAEAQIRVAEILGHKPVKPEPAVEEPAPVVEEAPVVEDIFGWEASDEESAEVAPVETAEGELDWERLAEQLEEVEEEIPVAPVPEGDDALAWLESLAVGEMIEEFVAETEAAAEVVASESLAEAPEEEMEEAPASEGFFGWEAFGEEITEVAAPTAEGDFMSGDDALAWLESLAAGKEEELRAQAEAEAQIRVAEILGHRAEAKPAEPEPVVEEPVVVAKETPTVEGFFGWEAFGEEITEVENAAPVVEEVVSAEVESVAEGIVEDGAESAVSDGVVSDLLSGDDALAWLESLAAGKEEELRAQAEAETQARVAEILGRRPEPKTMEPPVAVVPEPVVEKPAEPEIAATGVAPISVAAEAPIAEGDVMSGDDALAWLSSLAAGKEEELRAQAEAETQARVAEILGRKPSAKAPAPEEPVAPETPAPEPIVAEAPVEIAEKEFIVEEAFEEKIVVAPEPVAEVPEAAPEAAAEPGEAGGLLAQARAAWKAGDVDTALAHYNELIQTETGLGDVIVDLQKAIAEQPNNAALYQMLGDAYMTNGMVDKAIDIFNKAMGLL